MRRLCVRVTAARSVVVGAARSSIPTSERRRSRRFALVRSGSRVQASADARELAAQIRPLAINVNDLDRRARAGESVALSAEVPELIELLREVRALLGDRAAS